MADFAFYEGLAKTPRDIVAVAREVWPGREMLWLAVTAGDSLFGKTLARHCAMTLAALAEHDWEALGGGRTLHVGLLPRGDALAVPSRQKFDANSGAIACISTPELAVA